MIGPTALQILDKKNKKEPKFRSFCDVNVDSDLSIDMSVFCLWRIVAEGAFLERRMFLAWGEEDLLLVASTWSRTRDCIPSHTSQPHHPTPAGKPRRRQKIKIKVKDVKLIR